MSPRYVTALELAAALRSRSVTTFGEASVDFGAFPGSDEGSVTITGQSGIVATSVVDAWLVAEATADHSADEHRIEALKVTAGNIVAGTGFTIWVRPLEPYRSYGLFRVGWSWATPA